MIGDAPPLSVNVASRRTASSLDRKRQLERVFVDTADGDQRHERMRGRAAVVRADFRDTLRRVPTQRGDQFVGKRSELADAVCRAVRRPSSAPGWPGPRHRRFRGQPQVLQAQDVAEQFVGLRDLLGIDRREGVRASARARRAARPFLRCAPVSINTCWMASTCDPAVSSVSGGPCIACVMANTASARMRPFQIRHQVRNDVAPLDAAEGANRPASDLFVGRRCAAHEQGDVGRRSGKRHLQSPGSRAPGRSPQAQGPAARVF